MSILTMLIGLAIFGFVLWLIVTYIPMPEPVKKAIIVLAVLCVILWLASSIGLLAPLNTPIRVR